jgi:hypothetical protein
VLERRTSPAAAPGSSSTAATPSTPARPC